MHCQSYLVIGSNVHACWMLVKEFMFFSDIKELMIIGGFYIYFNLGMI